MFKRLATSGKSGDMNWGKVYNLYIVKTEISAMLTVKSGLDPHMIIELEDEINRGPMVIFMLLLYLLYFF
jgi:hypothetical protein